VKHPFSIVLKKSAELVDKGVKYKDFPRWIRFGYWAFNVYLTYFTWDEIKRGFPQHKIIMQLRRNRKKLEKDGIFLSKD